MSCRRSGYSFKCIIKSCGEKKTQKESISYFSFPKDPVRCEIWLERCQLPADTLSQKNVKLCGKHFEKIMFLNFLENRLKPDAIPTLFPDKKDNCNASTSTDLSSEKVRFCTGLSNTVSCSSNTPLNITDDPERDTYYAPYVRSMGMSCCIPNCKKRFIEDRQTRSTFTFPKDSARCAVWIEKSGCEFLKSVNAALIHKKYRLCALHFEDRMYANYQKNRLKPDAIPTLFKNEDVLETVEKVVQESFCSSPEAVSVDPLKTISPKKEKIYNIALCSTPSRYLSIIPTCTAFSMSDASTSTQIKNGNTVIRTSREVSLKTKLINEIALRKKMERRCVELSNELSAINSLENSLKIIKPHVSPSLYLLLKSQIENKDKKKARIKVFRLIKKTVNTNT